MPRVQIFVYDLTRGMAAAMSPMLLGQRCVRAVLALLQCCSCYLPISSVLFHPIVLYT
jgi:hypothetical protein